MQLESIKNILNQDSSDFDRELREQLEEALRNHPRVLKAKRLTEIYSRITELNSEISTCGSCGFSGYDFEKVFAEDGTIRWKCPRCEETDPEIVHTSYRICGYISNYTPNEGRSQDIKNRVKHLNIEEG